MTPYRQAENFLLTYRKSMRRPLDGKCKAANCMMKSFALPFGGLCCP